MPRQTRSLGAAVSNTRLLAPAQAAFMAAAYLLAPLAVLLAVTALATGCSTDRDEVRTAQAVARALTNTEADDFDEAAVAERLTDQVPEGIQIGWADGPRGHLLGCARQRDASRWVCVTSDTDRRTDRDANDVRPLP